MDLWRDITSKYDLLWLIIKRRGYIFLKQSILCLQVWKIESQKKTMIEDHEVIIGENIISVINVCNDSSQTLSQRQ